MMRTLHYTLCVCAFGLLSLSQNASAQTVKYLMLEGQQLPPVLQNNQPLAFDDPEFEVVKYLKLKEPQSMRERIERLAHGIYVDLPPEYDHYGYEVRRYMAHVGGPLVPTSKTNVEGQLQNIKNAKIIAQHWQKTMFDEIKDIDEALKNSESESSYRALYKYNSGIVRAFFTELNSWLDNNETLLAYLMTVDDGGYTYEAPVFRFSDKKDLKQFARYYDAQIRALEQIRKYPPFRIMLY